jgi:hypothetical protein
METVLTSGRIISASLLASSSNSAVINYKWTALS